MPATHHRAHRCRLLLCLLAAACVPTVPTSSESTIHDGGAIANDGSARGGAGGVAGSGGGGGIGGNGGYGGRSGGSGVAGGSSGAGGTGGGAGARSDAARPTDARPPDEAPRASDTAAPSGGQPGDPGAGCKPGGSGFDTTTTGVAVDCKTSLGWERGDPQRDVSQCPLMIRDNDSKLCFDEAVKYCQSLRLDGRSDWRLPTIQELQSLVVPTTSPSIDTATFPQTVLSLYWSSQRLGEKIVCIDFSNRGTVNDHIGPDGPQALRCVRGPLPPH